MSEATTRNVDREFNWILKPRVDSEDRSRWTYPRSKWVRLTGTVPEVVREAQDRKIDLLGLRVSRSKGSFWVDESRSFPEWVWLFR